MLEFLKKKKRDKNPGTGGNNNNDGEAGSDIEIPDVDGATNAIDAALQLDAKEQERKVKAAAEKERAEQKAREAREGSRCGCW